MRFLLAVILLAVSGVATALPWSKDMVDQPSVKPQETEVREPERSVPESGKEVMPVPANVAEVVSSRLVAARQLQNPVAPEAPSVERGAEIYAVHCQVCHGDTGKGDGPVGRKFVPPPMDLTTTYVQTQADGQIFYTITHGGVAMPFYRDAVQEIDRWHLVNYIKSELAPE